MTTRIPSKLRKAVDDPFRGIPGIGRATISFDGQDHLSITVPGWSPTFSYVGDWYGDALEQIGRKAA